MKCSACGKEFGEGTHCQKCGIARVTFFYETDR